MGDNYTYSTQIFEDKQQYYFEQSMYYLDNLYNSQVIIKSFSTPFQDLKYDVAELSSKNKVRNDKMYLNEGLFNLYNYGSEVIQYLEEKSEH